MGVTELVFELHVFKALTLKLKLRVLLLRKPIMPQN